MLSSLASHDGAELTSRVTFAALDTSRRVDDVRLTLVAGNTGHGTAFRAKRTTDTLLGIDAVSDEMLTLPAGHFFSFHVSEISFSKYRGSKAPVGAVWPSPQREASAWPSDPFEVFDILGGTFASTSFSSSLKICLPPIRQGTLPQIRQL
jgi:hypothetical protein